MGGYNKIIDTQNRVLNTGWYNPPNRLFSFFPSTAFTQASFMDGEVVNIVISYDGEAATGYLDGEYAADSDGDPTAGLSAERVFHLFVDDLPLASQVSPGSVAAVFVWDGTLDAQEIADLLPLPQLIEPCNASDTELPFGIVDLSDINKFVTSFLAQDPAADLDPDGLYDLADIIAFIDAFNGGCP